MKNLCLCLLLLTCCTAASAQAYKKLHQQAIVVDTHNDFTSASIEKKAAFDTDLKGRTHSDLKRMQAGGVDAQIFSVWCDQEQQKPFAYANRQIDSVHAWVKRNPDKMMLVTSPEELAKAVKEKKLATMIGVEGGHMIEDKLENLDALHKRGASYLTITHNNSTSWATSAADETRNNGTLPEKGLTDFGRKVIKRMNELGMLVDVSHAGDQTFWDIMATTTKPVIASHSSVYSLLPHRRNLKDDQIKAIAENGGVIHVNFYAEFLDSTYGKFIGAFISRHKNEINELVANNVQPDYAYVMITEKYKEELQPYRPPLSALIDHIDYIVKLVGPDHVGLGSDFDGISASPLQLDGVQDFPVITKALLEKGYKEKDIKKILGENFIRVYKANHAN